MNKRLADGLAVVEHGAGNGGPFEALEMNAAAAAEKSGFVIERLIDFRWNRKSRYDDAAAVFGELGADPQCQARRTEGADLLFENRPQAAAEHEDGAA